MTRLEPKPGELENAECAACSRRCDRGLFLRERPRRWCWCPRAPDQRREQARATVVAGCQAILAAIAATP
jgi:hypothetical protein